MGSAAFKAARHEQTLEAAAAVIAGIDKALVSQGTGHIHRQAAFAMPRVCVAVPTNMPPSAVCVPL